MQIANNTTTTTTLLVLRCDATGKYKKSRTQTTRNTEHLLYIKESISISFVKNILLEKH